MGRTVVIILRVVQGLLALANLALAAYVYNWYSTVAHRPSPGALQFLVFAPCVSLASIAYLEIAARQRRMVMAHRLTAMGVEGLNAILYLGGFVALALTLSDEDAASAGGAPGKAVAVLAAAEFSAWIASAVLAAHEWFRSEAQMNRVTEARREMAEAAESGRC
ncbi:MARVEL-like domain protein [Cordyceps fumosorosea ARSEF 2679]|uniref:MARVEL-like domain protein n=1 Tax=Cordyceps fumosorosea (strain ARSEF 2679) TaxID=1081104 RepID=A0A168CCL2_CORFA|nr:MARVEL-like domain protein [Cordyceps fumosorosea ARSEF 2679]OAA71226.1 MARVEL-like domain protein [Cordyceps fumosorosea ARSEF 2679]